MKRREWVGLWARIGLAATLTLAGLAVLLVAEYVVVTAMIVMVVFFAPTWGGSGLVIAVIVAAGLGCWWLIAALLGRLGPPGTVSGRINDDGVADLVAGLGATLRTPPSGRQSAKLLAGIVAVSLGLILGHAAVTERLGIDLWPVCLVLGGVVVVGYTGWLVVAEFRSGGTVQATLEDDYNVVSDPERERLVTARVRRLAVQAGCSVPAVRIGASWVPQAATVGYRPGDSEIVVSRGLVETLSERELDAVLAHELAHLLNRDAAVLTALSVPRAKAVRLLSSMGLFGLAAGAPVIVANVLSVPVVARYREYVADHAAAELTGDAAAVAGALATIDEEYREVNREDMRTQPSTAAFGIVPPPWRERHVLDGAIRFVRRRIFGTHPPTEKRIERLQARME
jgi:heat shock protein HtpX